MGLTPKTFQPNASLIESTLNMDFASSKPPLTPTNSAGSWVQTPAPPDDGAKRSLKLYEMNPVIPRSPVPGLPALGLPDLLRGALWPK